ncbi:hypothetical protein [Pseudoalteromonas rubra]|uniref:hypothetical protein n=1 Tax=Pseudoalteromonas rubra TaxID=43658 RepID=UPI0013DDB2EA|nr:hypothetical protein [Pseudoalteromonas rubra]
MKLQLNKKSIKQLGKPTRTLAGGETPQIAGGAYRTAWATCNTAIDQCDTFHFKSCLC